jgi:methylmalonyl-CoA mutase
MTKEENLFDQFPPVSTKEWMDKITSDLKGADFNRRMVWKSNEGFDVMPFYRNEDLEKLMYIDSLPGEFPFIRGKKPNDNIWLVRQNITVSDYPAANQKAIDIMMKGVDSLGFIIDDPESVCEKNFDLLLKDINTENIEINFFCNGKAKELVDLVVKKVNGSGPGSDNIKGAFEADPISRLMVNGTLCVPLNEGFDYLTSVTAAASVLPDFRTIHINASYFNNAGADIVRQLAFAISMGKEYMTQLTDRGIKPDIAATSMRFSFGIGSNYFGEIAKLRAARLLWSVVTEGYKPENRNACSMEIHCSTSRWNKTVYDPYVNMLRTQTEAMSAILGGTNSLTVESFNTASGQPDEFSERIARNQQLILKEESYFDKVADPGAGSYYIENLTYLIADNAWKLFLKIEEQGGFVQALEKGYIQRELSESASDRRRDISVRKTILVGTNQFPDPGEKISSQTNPLNPIKGSLPKGDFEIEPITIFRAAEEYEKIRMAVDKSHFQPVVFLFTIGNHSMRKARAQFSANFFGCAGYKVIDNSGFERVDDGISEAVKSEADIVVVCSSDEEYMIYAPEIFSKLKEKTIVVIAGTPPSIEDLKAKGINDFISIRSDVVETLKLFNSRLGITG